ncbi:hypothetical protein BDA99DRAFT_533157 [Phascolomyces articulosus]|uniref:Uncharacterized protein n=1 Tax=Phascolomyces articulosus TaxID=60185 RepID=A0AAD5PHP9_9FUNG|nr:hypothetical protein BDA99DRAFT_533157 [Phascolomyces articulosus]
MLKALELSHVHEVKEQSKSQSSTLLELEGEHQALRHLYNAASKQLGEKCKTNAGNTCHMMNITLNAFKDNTKLLVLVPMKINDNYFVATTIGDMYLPMTLDDISDFHKTLILLLHWKNEHLKLRKVVRGPLLRQRRLERSRKYLDQSTVYRFNEYRFSERVLNTSPTATSASTNPDIFFTPTHDRPSK